MFDSKKFYVCSALFLLEIIGGTLSLPTYALPDAHLGGGGLGNHGGFHGGLGDHGGFHGGLQEVHSLVSNDHHGGVSIIGAGASAHKGITLDLTKEGGSGHVGLFGGSFISSGGHGGQSGHSIHGGHEIDDHGLGAYSSGLTSYDVGRRNHEATYDGEISPVLYSSYKEGEHNFGLHSLHSASLHSGGEFTGGHNAALAAPATVHFDGSGLHLDHSSGFSH